LWKLTFTHTHARKHKHVHVPVWGLLGLTPMRPQKAKSHIHTNALYKKNKISKILKKINSYEKMEDFNIFFEPLWFILPKLL